MSLAVINLFFLFFFVPDLSACCAEIIIFFFGEKEEGRGILRGLEKWTMVDEPWFLEIVKYLYIFRSLDFNLYLEKEIEKFYESIII